MTADQSGDDAGKPRNDRQKRLGDALRRNLRLRKAATRPDTSGAAGRPPDAGLADRAATLADRLRDTARAHHEAFAATNGADPDWAAWYAADLATDLPALLGRALSVAEIERLLLEAEAARVAAAAADWPGFYGRFLAAAA